MYSYLYKFFFPLVLRINIQCSAHSIKHTYFTVQCYAYTPRIFWSQQMLLNLHRTRPDQNNTIFILIKIQLTNEKMFFVCSFVWVSGFVVLLTRSFVRCFSDSSFTVKVFAFIWSLLSFLLLILLSTSCASVYVCECQKNSYTGYYISNMSIFLLSIPKMRKSTVIRD